LEPICFPEAATCRPLTRLIHDECMEGLAGMA
jgi:hypothetical protein